MRNTNSPPKVRRLAWLGATLALPALIAAAPAPAATPLITSIQVTAEPFPGQAPRANPAFICSGEVVEVAVAAQHPSGPGHRVSVEIDGYPGDTRYLQFWGDPGPRHIAIRAATDTGDLDAQTVQIQVDGCEVTAIPEVRSRFNPYEPLTADFVVTAHETLASDIPVFHWDFGDGTTATSELGYIKHSYADSVDGSEPYETFTVMVSNLPIIAGVPTPGAFTRRYSVAIQDPYYHSKLRGIVQPRVHTVARMDLHGSVLVGSYAVENLESEAIIYEYAELEQLACAPDGPSSSSSILPSDVLFQGGYGIAEEDAHEWESPEMIAAKQIKERIGNLPDDTFVVPPVIDPDAPTGLSSAIAPPTGGSQALASRTSTTSVNLNLPSVPPPPPSGPSGFLVIPARHRHEGFLNLEIGDIDLGTCVVAYHLVGHTESGLRVYTDLYFEARESAAMSGPLQDQQMADFLLEVIQRGWASDPTELTSADLYRLEMEGKVQQTENGWEVR